MKKEFKNSEIEQILTVINGKNSFVYTTKMPAQIRHAIRVNRKVLTERMNIYFEERKEILENYVNNGYATIEGDNVHVEEMYQSAILKELQEIADVTNEVEIETVESDVLENFLNAHELTMAEEDTLLLFEK